MRKIRVLQLIHLVLHVLAVKEKGETERVYRFQIVG